MKKVFSRLVAHLKGEQNLDKLIQRGLVVGTGFTRMGGVIIDPSKYDNESLLDQAKQALASNWAEQGFEPGVPYDIYVTANNPHTAAATAPSNLTALQALTTNTTDIYRYYLTYTPSQEDRIYWTNCMYSEKKNFLMDGKIEGWTIDPSQAEQVFDVDLKRAAAKILLTVNFSDEKTIPMIPEKLNPGDPDPTPVTDASGHVVMGSVKEYMQLVGRTAGEPRIKPVNFNLNCSDVAYDADPLPGSGSLLTIDSNFSIFKEGSSTDNTDNTFAAVTYTYPIDWSSDNSRTPYILLSVFFTRDSDGDQLRSYYRIPVCDESQVSSLERNNIYIIDVKIASLGASNESFDAKDEELRIEYHVIPWTETNMTQEATTVKISDTKYLTIIPTEYTLKGDDEQSVDLQWFASVSVDDGRIVDIDPNSLHVSYVNYQSATVDIRGTVTKQVRNDGGTLVTATDANTDGRRDIVIEGRGNAHSERDNTGEIRRPAEPRHQGYRIHRLPQERQRCGCRAHQDTPLPPGQYPVVHGGVVVEVGRKLHVRGRQGVFVQPGSRRLDKLGRI